MAITIPLFELGLISLGIATLFFIHEIALGLKTLTKNTISGLCVVGTCHALGLGITLTPLMLFEIAIGGIPAAIFVLFITYTGLLVYPI